MIDPLAELARRAYAIGWARSGGPMTDRVRAGSVAAVSLAVEHAGHPGVLEATANLGHMEGVRATLDARRDALDAANLAAIAAAWQALVGQLNRDRLLRGVARRMGVAITEADKDNGDGDDKAALAAIIRSALENTADNNPTAWAALRQTVRDAIAAARGEGHAAAVTHAGHRANPGAAVDTAAAADDATDELEHIGGLWTEADGWIQDMFGYAAGDVGRALAALEDPDHVMVRDVIDGFLDDPDPRAVEVAVDQLTGRSMIRGVLDLFSSAGIAQVDVVAVAGACPRCLEAEAGGPYRVGAAPDVPLHPWCRCELQPVTDLPADLISMYLAQEAA